MTRAERFAKVMASVCVVYQVELTDLLIETYSEALKGMGIEDIERTAARHIKTGTFFPKPADFLRQVEGTAEDRARMSFRLVLQAMRRIGPYHAVQFTDPKIHYALDAVGGWETLAECPEDEIQFLEKRYAGHFQDADRLGLTWGSPGVPTCLPGIIWRENGAKGYALPPAHRVDEHGEIKQIPAHEVKALPGKAGELAEAAIKALERRAEG